MGYSPEQTIYEQHEAPQASMLIPDVVEKQIEKEISNAPMLTGIIIGIGCVTLLPIVIRGIVKRRSR